jgi:hypothetical protein
VRPSGLRLRLLWRTDVVSRHELLLVSLTEIGRQLPLLQASPASIQEQIRAGIISARAARRHRGRQGLRRRRVHARERYKMGRGLGRREMCEGADDRDGSRG